MTKKLPGSSFSIIPHYVPREKWLTVLDIYWELSMMDEAMRGYREQFVTRGARAPKKSRAPEPFRSYIESTKNEAFSTAFAWEFYLQCTDYHKGARGVLDRCDRHLKSKSLDEYLKNLIVRANTFQDLFTAVFEEERSRGKDWYKLWYDGLTKDGREEVQSILDDPTFIRKDEQYDGDLFIWSGKVFENPFDYIDARVWVWNAAVDYCLTCLKALRVTRRQELTFRAMIDRLGRHRDFQGLVAYLAKERDTKDRDTTDTLLRTLQKTKQLIPIQHKKSRP
jgi:hypothetical protein